MTDAKVYNHGSIMLLKPLTEAAQEWIEVHIDEHMDWCGSVVVEPRYIEAILGGMTDDGLNVTYISS
jgi:hypothetical protein